MVKKNKESNKKKEKETEVDSEKNTSNLSDINKGVESSEFESDTKDKSDQSKEILELNKEIEDLKEEKLRLLAEMENLRKRSEREKVDSIKYGSINIARDILSPNDNLSRALNAISLEEEIPETFKNLIEGLKMVKKELISVLEKHGVKKIDAINKKFDHNFHQAVLEIEKDDCDEGIVVQEIQSGFTMHDRLLRPSMVGVSKKTEDGKKKQQK